MKTSLLLAAVFAASALAQPSQLGTISGRVLDPSGAAVPGARVSLIERATLVRRSVQSEPAGTYRFSSVRTGEYLVEAFAPGLGTSEPIEVRIQSGEARGLDLQLELPRLATQVQVTAAGTAQTVDEQAKALDIIDSVQVERRAEFSVAEALRTVPGIRIQQFGGPGSLVRILSRGMRPQDTSVLIDGFRLRDAAAPQGDVSAFASDLLLPGTDRVEVLRGSGSSLYGTHATGGVVNIISDQGGGIFRGELGGEGGSLGLFRGTAKFAGGAFEDRLRYTTAFTHLNVTRGLDKDDRARNSSVHAFLQYQLAPRTVMSGRLLAIDSFVQLNDSPFAAPASTLPLDPIIRAVPGVTFTPDLNDPDWRRSGVQWNTLLLLSHTWSPTTSARIGYQHLETNRDSWDGPAGARFEPLWNELNRFDGRIDTVQARADFDRGVHLLTAGYEFETEALENTARDLNPDPAARANAVLSINQSNHAVFVQDQIRLLQDRLQVSLSGRVHNFQLEAPSFRGANVLYPNVRLETPPRAWTGDGSIAYFNPRSGTKLRAHVGNSYRAPALYERFGAGFFAGFFSGYGDPNIAPERLIAVDGGVDQYLASTRARISATYFYTRIQEAIIFDFSGAIVPQTDPYGRFGGYRNTGGGLSRGVELSVEMNPHASLALLSSYTYTNADDRFSQFTSGILRSIRISNHMFTAVATQQLGRSVDVTFDLFAADNYLFVFGGRAFQFDGPVKADLSANYTRHLSDRQALRFFTRVENILNRKYFEEGFRTPGTWATAGVKFLF